MSNNESGNPNQFLLDWLARVEEQHLQYIAYRNQLLREYHVYDNVREAVSVNAANYFEIGPVSFNSNNNYEEEIADNISIISISDDGEQSAIVIGNDILLSAGLIENVENIENVNGAVIVNEINEPESENEIQSNNSSGYGSIDIALDNDDVERVGRVRNAAVIAASNIREQMMGEDISDAETEIFDYEQERNHRMLVVYSDSESDESDSDSVFGKFDEPNESAAQPQCPVCYEELLSRQPHCIHPCGHFICLKCLIRLCKLRRREWKCPICRNQIESKGQCTRAFFM